MTSTVVVGASRGLGRGIALALARAGRPTVAVARSSRALLELAQEVEGITPEVADARSPEVAQRLLDTYQPAAVAVVAGAAPELRPVHEHSWTSFSANWDTDVRTTFTWLGEVLRGPLRPRGRVIVVSSGAALHGSPLSGGYAGAKAMQRFLARYAQDEAGRAGLDITFVTLLPTLTPRTGLGRAAAAAYAARSGLTDQEYLAQLGAPLTPAAAGSAVLDLLSADRSRLAAEYLLDGEGLHPLPS